MLGIVGSVLAVVSKRTQQIPKMLGPAVHRENDGPWLCMMRVRSANNVGRVLQTGPTLLRYALAITEQM